MKIFFMSLMTFCFSVQSYAQLDYERTKTRIMPWYTCEYDFLAQTEVVPVPSQSPPSTWWAEVNAYEISGDVIASPNSNPNPHRTNNHNHLSALGLVHKRVRYSLGRATVKSRHKGGSAGFNLPTQTSMDSKTIPCGFAEDSPCTGCEDDPDPDPLPPGPCTTFPVCDLTDTSQFDPCPSECSTPILVDLRDNGFSFAGHKTSVYFDLLGTGAPIHIQWVAAGTDDAFLFMDINQNGIVDDGSELFGSGTRLVMEGSRHAPNGFVGLGQYDHPDMGGDGDTYISSTDLIWSYLKLWNDLNADAVCTEDEVIALETVNLSRFDTIPRETKQWDPYGNKLQFWGRSYTTAQRFNQLPMVDVMFKHIPQ